MDRAKRMFGFEEAASSVHIVQCAHLLLLLLL